MGRGTGGGSCSRVAVGVSRGGAGAGVAASKEPGLEKGHDLMLPDREKIAARVGWWLWYLSFVLYMWVGLCVVSGHGRKKKLRSCLLLLACQVSCPSIYLPHEMF
jgi:hypothetical protein